MNFLDQIQQDQEAAKSDLNSMLNQKAFDLLDTYAAGPEIEVVTFSEDENSLTEEDLDEMSEEDFDALDEEQLDELSKATLASYAKKAAVDAKFKGFTAGYTEGDSMARSKKYGGGSGAGAEDDNKAHKRLRGVSKAIDRLTKEEVEDLDEGVGNLAGLSKHLLKTVTGSVYSGRSAGEHSEVESHPIKNKSAHRAVLNKALDDGHVPVVYVNGKIHSAGHSTGTSYGRAEFNIHDADKQKDQKETIYPKPRRYGGKLHYSEPYHTSNPRYSKGDALDQLTPGHEASFYKENKVEVKVVKADKVRQKVRTDRHANAPTTQDNYVKSKPGEKGNDIYMDNRKKTSTTSAGDNLKAIKDAAALRLATKKLGGDSPSANKKAMDLHTELGKHLAAGNHRDAINTAHALADHVRNQGLTTHADKIKDYADTLKGLKDTWRGKEYSHKKLAQMRGETNESEELVQALELMLTEMLDINEEQLDEGIKVGKTVWTSHTDKPLKGKIVSKDDDNKDQYIISTKDGNHSVHQDHIHFKEEHAKLMQEAVVPGSVKKDKHGNVLSFKSEPDKKLVKDRKTGKMYDPEAEFDKLISKKK